MIAARRQGHQFVRRALEAGITQIIIEPQNGIGVGDIEFAIGPADAARRIEAFTKHKAALGDPVLVGIAQQDQLIRRSDIGSGPGEQQTGNEALDAPAHVTSGRRVGQAGNHVPVGQHVDDARVLETFCETVDLKPFCGARGSAFGPADRLGHRDRGYGLRIGLVEDGVRAGCFEQGQIGDGGPGEPPERNRQHNEQYQHADERFLDQRHAHQDTWMAASRQSFCRLLQGVFDFRPDPAMPKATLYRDLNAAAEALTEGERDSVANMANIAALLWQFLPECNWTGFYRRIGDELVLGPFCGRPACLRIPLGQGVCGIAASTGASQLVHDVHACPGHIACDAETRSELVVPVFGSHEDGEAQVIAVIDCDSPRLGRFDLEDQLGLEELARTLANRISGSPAR